jgi:hypothetical protein
MASPVIQSLRTYPVILSLMPLLTSPVIIILIKSVEIVLIITFLTCQAIKSLRNPSLIIFFVAKAKHFRPNLHSKNRCVNVNKQTNTFFFFYFYTLAALVTF